MTSKHKLFASTALLAVALMTGAALAQQSETAHGHRSHHVARAIAKADADKDGALSHAEFVAAHEKRFVRLDANRDGKIDRGEFLRGRDKTERKEQRREAAFKNADANQDGVVNREEWMALADKRFTTHDRNADGKLTKDGRARAKGTQRPATPPTGPTTAD
jgi:hypothetical protein